MLENRVQERIFGPKREEVMKSWRNPYNGKFHNLNCSPNIIRVIKSRRRRGVGQKKDGKLKVFNK
jgi:hypothetical protein